MALLVFRRWFIDCALWHPRVTNLWNSEGLWLLNINLWTVIVFQKGKRRPEDPKEVGYMLPNTVQQSPIEGWRRLSRDYELVSGLSLHKSDIWISCRWKIIEHEPYTSSRVSGGLWVWIRCGQVPNLIQSQAIIILQIPASTICWEIHPFCFLDSKRTRLMQRM